MYPAIEQYRRAAEGEEMTGSADLLTGAQGRDGHYILAHDDYILLRYVVLLHESLQSNVLHPHGNLIIIYARRLMILRRERHQQRQPTQKKTWTTTTMTMRPRTTTRRTGRAFPILPLHRLMMIIIIIQIPSFLSFQRMRMAIIIFAMMMSSWGK